MGYCKQQQISAVQQMRAQQGDDSRFCSSKRPLWMQRCRRGSRRNSSGALRLMMSRSAMINLVSGRAGSALCRGGALRKLLRQKQQRQLSDLDNWRWGNTAGTCNWRIVNEWEAVAVVAAVQRFELAFIGISMGPVRLPLQGMVSSVLMYEITLRQLAASGSEPIMARICWPAVSSACAPRCPLLNSSS